MKPFNYDFHVEIQLFENCNFRCTYCFQDEGNSIHEIRKNMKIWIDKKIIKQKTLRDMSIEDISRNIEKLDRECLVDLIGGEPFIFPKFVELCKLITRKNHIRITTNLSTKTVLRFADEIDPSRVDSVLASIHISELEKYGLLSQFISNINYLQEKGFKVRTRYIMYPSLFGRFEKDRELFKSHNIMIETKKFRGVYDNKTYPQAYSESEWQTIKKYLMEDRKKLLDLNDNFKGRKCVSGNKSILVREDGRVYRCWSDHKPIGNFFKGKIDLFDNVKLCRVNKCFCPYVGVNLLVD
ncbi:radical SAM protein [Candidatus Woesearchaeota archaeon]|nr:radical SAM protein [Candidatus Woesearchaeota archaeon]